MQMAVQTPRSGIIMIILYIIINSIIIVIIIVIINTIIIIIIIIIITGCSTYVMAVVITVICSVRRVVANDQRLTELSFLYVSNTFLDILAVPNNAVFCITPTLFVIYSFSIHPSNFFVTLPRAPVTTGTTPTVFSLQNLPFSLFTSWYFSIFSVSFALQLHQLVQQYRWLSPFTLSCQLNLCLVFLPLLRCYTEHWYPTTLSLLHLLFLYCSFWDVFISFFPVF